MSLHYKTKKDYLVKGWNQLMKSLLSIKKDKASHS